VAKNKHQAAAKAHSALKSGADAETSAACAWGEITERFMGNWVFATGNSLSYAISKDCNNVARHIKMV
jgi:hypothetical protein